MNEPLKLEDGTELQDWSEELNLRTEDLEEIIEEVGPSIHEVRMFMAKKQLVAWPQHAY